MVARVSTSSSASFFRSSRQRLPLPRSVGLAGFVGELSTPVHTVMAIGLMYTLPAVIFYLFVQRYVVAGMTAGSVKG